ncbi:ATP-binding cassette domain-containing protein [Streptacidiphilus fuscans]|uniref:ATP-binding cassette domain-containing protein n=1 Tax=Streptacidiphilus fuscans TaxID=2789292 RepID=A0A931B4E2_9ACTN|nr:ATP-binding cassette domain-containing protein [Streptacidiphilus fuscans]MBF9066690.1 ATP-binding cassette domain-containing protein [Streptacidiphilus fuscans]
MSPWRLLRRAVPLRDLALGVGMAVLAELSAAALLGVSGWFLTACALVTMVANTTWSWMYPSGAVRALALARTFLRYLERMTSHRTALATTVALRGALARGAARLTPRQLRAEGDGTLLGRLTVDVEAVAGLPAQTVAPLAGCAATAVAAEALLFRASPLLGVVELAVLALGVGWTLRGHRRARRHRADAARARQAARAGLIGARGGFDELRCLDAVTRVRAGVAASLAEEESLAAEAQRAERRARLGLRLLAGLGQAAGLLVALDLGRAPQPVADALGEVLLLTAVWELLDRLPDLLREAAESRDAAGRLAPLADGPGVRGGAAEPSPTADALTVAGLLTLRHGVPLSFTVRPPEVVVVTGANGSGKSTLLDQLAGRLGNETGEVLLDGSRVAELPAQVIAGQLAMVEAHDWLADATVADNLCQADPLADPDRLTGALASVGLERIPLDTPVGQAGRALSLGERRRLAVARALLRKPRYLLLDEPTEGLDRPTAEAFLTGIRAALPEAALVIALQRQDLGLLPWQPDRVIDLDVPSGRLDNTAVDGTSGDRAGYRVGADGQSSNRARWVVGTRST